MDRPAPRLYRTWLFGTLKPTLAAMTDLDGRASSSRWTPLVVLTILIGILTEAGPRYVGGVGDGAALLNR